MMHVGNIKGKLSGTGDGGFRTINKERLTGRYLKVLRS